MERFYNYDKNTLLKRRTSNLNDFRCYIFILRRIGVLGIIDKE